MDKQEVPKKIDRFDIKKILGKGSQGIVYLAQDSSLDREVAIKAMRLQNHSNRHENINNLLEEAKTVSKMQHSHIVSIFDVGTVNEQPYLVLEYVEGESLADKLKQGLSIDRCLQLMTQILSGMAAAHETNIIHCDIKPANILINENGDVKITDFGLSHLANQQGKDYEGLIGTPHYMAPEYIETQQHQKVSDVFSLGLVFYEMLAGKPAFEGDDVYQLLNAIANTDVLPPSKHNELIDENLDALVLKTLQKDPNNRYADAAELQKALNDCVSLTNDELAIDSNDSTINFLIRRMRHKNDFPAFSKTISVLNKASSSETEGLASISNAILKDYSLTNKVLKVVNSAYYNRGGNKISTISRALVMLGINPVRNIAASLLLFEHLQNKQQSHALKDDAISSLFSAFVANNLAQDNNVKKHEEAFLCAMLQQLGKFLIRFYLYDDSVQINNLIQLDHLSEDSASIQVLGTTYHKIGIAIAQEWGFPPQFINSMTPLDPDKIKEPRNDDDKLTVLSSFSNNLSHALQKPLKQQAPAVKTLISQYGKAITLDEERVSSLIEHTHKELTEFSKLINFDITKSRFYQQLSSTGDSPTELTEAERTKKEDLNDSEQAEILQDTYDQTHENSEIALTDGIQDITNTLNGEYTINQVMQMILETIYRALEGSRVILCLKGKDGFMHAKFGYGEEVESTIKNFSIPLKYEADVFHVAFKNNVDIKIADTQDSKIKNKIPMWFHNKIKAKSFLIFPIVIKDVPIALIYIDGAQQRSIDISDNQLGLLKTLRNQSILAINNLS